MKYSVHEIFISQVYADMFYVCVCVWRNVLYILIGMIVNCHFK